MHITHTCTFLISATANGTFTPELVQTQVFTGCSNTHTQLCHGGIIGKHTHMPHTWQQMTSNHRTPSNMNPNNEFTVLHGSQESFACQFHCDSTIYNGQMFWISFWNFKFNLSFISLQNNTKHDNGSLLILGWWKLKICWEPRPIQSVIRPIQTCEFKTDFLSRLKASAHNNHSFTTLVVLHICFSLQLERTKHLSLLFWGVQSYSFLTLNSARTTWPDKLILPW